MTATSFEGALRKCEEPVRAFVLIGTRAAEPVAFGLVALVTEFDPPAPHTVPSGWYLMGLFVAPPFRRGGVARALTRARLAWIRERAPEAWYFSDASNAASIALHREAGFAEVTREFVAPGVTFDSGVGVLFRCALPERRPNAYLEGVVVP